MTAEAFLAPWRRRSFSDVQQHLNAAARWDGQGAASLDGTPQVDFSGKALICVNPYAMGVDPLIADGVATYALCSSRVRCGAKVGDVIIAVTPPQSSAKTRGVDSEERLVLSIGLVEDSMAVATYHSLAAPAWACGRADRVYRATAVVGNRNTREGRAVQKKFKKASYARKIVRPCNVEETRPGDWNVDYGNISVRYVLRARSRFHSLDGLNRILPEERSRDFSGHVLVSRLCKSFAAKGGEQMPLPRCLRKSSYFGQGFRRAAAPRGSALRRWLCRELGREL